MRMCNLIIYESVCLVIDSNNGMFFLREIVKPNASAPYLSIYQSNIYTFFWNYVLSVCNSHIALPGWAVHTLLNMLDEDDAADIL